jgi:hypothetical protein
MDEIINIEFAYRIDGLPKEIPLLAQVEKLSQSHYVAKEIKTANGRQVLQPQRIMKKKNLWVHIDSHMETHLSLAIGNAIELALSKGSLSGLKGEIY